MHVCMYWHSHIQMHSCSTVSMRQGKLSNHLLAFWQKCAFMCILKYFIDILCSVWLLAKAIGSCKKKKPKNYYKINYTNNTAMQYLTKMQWILKLLSRQVELSSCLNLQYGNKIVNSTTAMNSQTIEPQLWVKLIFKTKISNSNRKTVLNQTFDPMQQRKSAASVLFANSNKTNSIEVMFLCCYVSWNCIEF